ncbi:MAG: nicotinamide mononucleotide transporter [Candidatus Gastranaerophilales bacterium]|nr:nicotinamide mononucleotide transporter [Candidatus Gastranaerophilales bacterium]
MKIFEFVKKELEGFSFFEKLFFAIVIFLVCIISIYLNDSKIALVSALAGISYTILAGKGKISCYFIGMIGTFCYCYLSFKNGFYGNLALYGLYYFPMEIIGIWRWAKHLKKDKQEIIKKKLSIKKRIGFYLSACFASVIAYFFLKYIGAKTPLFDAISVVFSIFGQILTVKRCYEQWHFWFVVNLCSLIMWIIAYLNGSNCFATILMWLVYLILTFYFIKQWKKELNN